MSLALNNWAQGFIQKCKVTANISPWIPVHNDERQQEQASRAKHSRVACTFETKAQVTERTVTEQVNWNKLIGTFSVFACLYKTPFLKTSTNLLTQSADRSCFLCQIFEKIIGS